MDILIDNKNLETYYGVKVLDYSGILSLAAERENERTWYDKSGVDRNLENIKYDAKEFLLNCIVKAADEVAAYNVVNTLTSYMFSKGCFVLSIRGTGIRECFLCRRSNAIIPEIHVRGSNGLYVFKLGLKDVNPNALKFKNTIATLQTTINYTKGRWAQVYWGDGRQEIISNSGNYTKTGYAANGLVDIIVDIDADTSTIAALTADFQADQTSIILPQSIQFGDLSTGTISIWAWDFGDGETSSEQNPIHNYAEPGTYTVTLQVFNSVNGFATVTKTNYITARNAVLMINGNDSLLINNTNKLLKN